MAAATEAQTAPQISAEIATQTHAKVGTHTCETVGDSPTPYPESNSTLQASQDEHVREAPDIKQRRECTAPRPGSDFRLVYG